MRARDVVGKRIVRVAQSRMWNDNGGGFVWNVDHLELEDGTLVWATTVETEGEYLHEFTALKPSRQA